MIQAIPTLYAGIRFRSRLEAKWAAFFDELGLLWQYEPIDLAGYIPDFLVDVDGQQVLVEVKPAHTAAECHVHESKIHRSGWAGLWVIVGLQFDIQHGLPLPLPTNSSEMWATACNKTQWPTQKPAVKHAKPSPAVNAGLFATCAAQIVSPHIQEIPTGAIAELFGGYP